MNLKMKNTNDIIYLNALPQVNITSNFLVMESLENGIGTLWYEFIEKTILISLTSDEHFKAIKEAFQSNIEIYDLKRSYVRDLLGIGSKFSVIDIIHKNGETSYEELINFNELISIYFDCDAETSQRMTIDRFFVFLWNKGLLQYPIIRKNEKFIRSENWRLYIEDTEIIQFFKIRFEKIEEMDIKSFGLNSMLSIVTSSKWKKLSDIKDSELFSIEKTVQEYNSVSKKKQKYTYSVLSDLRLNLINIGRKDITKPNISISKRKNYSKVRKFDKVDIVEFPNLKYIKEKAVNYYDVLEHEGLAVGTITGELSALNIFVEYLMVYYPTREISKKTIEEIFEPTNEINIYSILSNRYKDAKKTLNKIIKFLVHCDLFTIKAKKNVPKGKSKVSRQNYRSAMPKEMIKHIVEILKFRPPLLKTNWDRNKANSSWWKFEVYPVFPLMMLFGYYIPVRGEQVRNLCRQKSFTINNDKIESILINTDKNVNRKEYQEIPCVWDDLQIFAPFIKWHKEYFRNIPMVMYHNDINSPWEDIEPLFNTPQHLEPVSRATHFNYHKKLLCQYQLEVIENAKKQDIKDYPIVAWAKKGKSFFKDINELNMCSTDKLKDIEIMYDLHSLRVTGATRYLESGLGINLVMQLTGHTTPDTLLRIYINLNLNEKKDKLKSAIENIYFGEPKKQISNTSDLIRSEFIKAYEEDEKKLKDVLSKNNLFSLPRNTTEGSTHKEYVLGTEISNHPSTWQPMIFGICPAVKCPDGRENKCSLCPYLITGKLFVSGITLKANTALARFQRDSLLKEEETKKGYKNSALAQSLELQLEEILGWWDIMNKIDKNLTDNSSQNSLALQTKNNNTFVFESCSTELTYLANAYQAQLFGVEHDRMGLKMLTIKAIKIANQNKDNDMVNKLASDEIASIDYLMNFYLEKQIEDKHVKQFIEHIKYI